MKFIHTADWHLGRIFHERYLTEDQAYVLTQFIDLVRDEAPTAVIIAGDLYDRAVPPADAVTLLDEVLVRLAELHVPVIAISGNHDSTERIDFGSSFMRKDRIYLYGRAEPETRPVELYDETGPVYICPFAFADPATIRTVFNAPEVRSYAELFAVQAACLRNFVPKGKRSIAVAHAFVAGGTESDSERPLTIGGSAQVPHGVFADFDYTMLGHLHRPQIVGQENIAYSGSLLKYSFSEAEHIKGVDIVEMDAMGRCAKRSVHLTPRHDMRIIEGEFADIMEREEESEDYLLVRLTDASPVLDAMGRLRKKFPNVLNMELVGAMRKAESREVADIRKVSREDLFAKFIEEMSGTPMTKEEKAIMTEVWQEILEEEGQ